MSCSCRILRRWTRVMQCTGDNFCMTEFGSMPRSRPAYPIASVDRALRLLLLVAQRSRLRLSEASEALGVAPSTAHRLLAMLVFHDLVRQEDRYAYVPGPALAT